MPLRDAPTSVRKTQLLAPTAQELIAALDAELSERYPDPDDCFFALDPDEVADGRGAFFVAYRGDDAVGCGAFRRIDEAVGEIKRMYVRPAARGHGIGRAVLDEIETEARHIGLRRLVLETGVRQPEAIALYRRAGYADIPAFGDYTASPLSVCMGKDLR